MYWYNPAIQDAEHRTAPTTDDEAIRILSARPETVEEYKGWRRTVGIVEAMIYTGQAFQEIDAGRQPPF